MLVYQRVYQLFYVIVNSMTLLIIIEFITIIISIVIIVITSITMIIIVIIYIYIYIYKISMNLLYHYFWWLYIIKIYYCYPVSNWNNSSKLDPVGVSAGLEGESTWPPEKVTTCMYIIYIYMYQKWIMMG